MRSRSLAFLALFGSGLALSGCANTRPTQQAFAPDDYRERHPIRIAQAPRHIDIFGATPALDSRQHRDLVDFAREQARRGNGGIEISTPAGVPHVSVAAIRSALAQGGLRAAVRHTSYPAGPGMAAPVRVTHSTLSAQVASECGQWPADLGGLKDAESWHNRPYYNLGCSYQSMLAAQVDDPVDLVRPRAMGEADLMKRTKDIESLRRDQDPSTRWQRDDLTISRR